MNEPIKKMQPHETLTRPVFIRNIIKFIAKPIFHKQGFTISSSRYDGYGARIRSSDSDNDHYIDFNSIANCYAVNTDWRETILHYSTGTISTSLLPKSNWRLKEHFALLCSRFNQRVGSLLQKMYVDENIDQTVSVQFENNDENQKHVDYWQRRRQDRQDCIDALFERNWAMIFAFEFGVNLFIKEFQNRNGGRKNCLKALNKHLPRQGPSWMINSPFRSAICHNNIPLVKIMLENDMVDFDYECISVNLFEMRNLAPGYYYTADSISMMWDTPVNRTDAHASESCFSIAASKGYLEIVELLVPHLQKFEQSRIKNARRNGISFSKPNVVKGATFKRKKMENGAFTETSIADRPVQEDLRRLWAMRHRITNLFDTPGLLYPKINFSPSVDSYYKEARQRPLARAIDSLRYDVVEYLINTLNCEIFWDQLVSPNSLILKEVGDRPQCAFIVAMFKSPKMFSIVLNALLKRAKTTIDKSSPYHPTNLSNISIVTKVSQVPLSFLEVQILKRSNDTSLAAADASAIINLWYDFQDELAKLIAGSEPDTKLLCPVELSKFLLHSHDTTVATDYNSILKVTQINSIVNTTLDNLFAAVISRALKYENVREKLECGLRAHAFDIVDYMVRLRLPKMIQVFKEILDVNTPRYPSLPQILRDHFERFPKDRDEVLVVILTSLDNPLYTTLNEQLKRRSLFIIHQGLRNLAYSYYGHQSGELCRAELSSLQQEVIELFQFFLCNQFGCDVVTCRNTSESTATPHNRIDGLSLPQVIVKKSDSLQLLNDVFEYLLVHVSRKLTDPVTNPNGKIDFDKYLTSLSGETLLKSVRSANVYPLTKVFDRFMYPV